MFFDRLDAALKLSHTDAQIRPTVICIGHRSFQTYQRDDRLSGRADSILLTVARRLGRILKPQDTLARLASDQFAAVVISESETDQIIAIANVVRRAVSTPVTFGETEVPLTASIGLALFDPQLHANREDMLNDAEIAVRHGKRIGGNRIEVFRSSMRSVRSDRLTLEADLRRALDRGEMQILFQPIIRLEDRTVAGFEALLRWDHPRLGRLSPAEFIPVAEETGSIVDLGIFRHGAHGARAFRLAGGRSISTRRFSPAVNIRRGNCSGTISCRTCAPSSRAGRSRAARSSSN